MRTTTVLLTAALSLVGAATTFAQVYSVNTVGYVNLTFKAGFNLNANPLDNKAANGNTIGNLFGSAMPDGTVIYKFTNGGYKPANDYTAPNPDLGIVGGWADPSMTLTPGEGAFIYVAAGSPTITFVGDVMEGTLVNTMKTGFNMVSSMVPQAGKLQADLGYVPTDGDVVYQFNAGAGYKLPASYTAPNPDLGIPGGWDPSEPSLTVGEAIWIQTSAATPKWTRTFDVSP